MHRMWSGGRKGKPDSSRNRSPFYRNGFPTPDTPPIVQRTAAENKMLSTQYE
jgi:hypothetical protein